MQIQGNKIFEIHGLVGFYERMSVITLNELNMEILWPKGITRADLEKMEQQRLEIFKALLMIAHHTHRQLIAANLYYQLLVEKEEANERNIVN